MNAEAKGVLAKAGAAWVRAVTELMKKDAELADFGGEMLTFWERKKLVETVSDVLQTAGVDASTQMTHSKEHMFARGGVNDDNLHGYFLAEAEALDPHGEKEG